jgi:hypothetical protein
MTASRFCRIFQGVKLCLRFRRLFFRILPFFHFGLLISQKFPELFTLYTFGSVLFSVFIFALPFYSQKLYEKLYGTKFGVKGAKKNAL